MCDVVSKCVCFLRKKVGHRLAITNSYNNYIFVKHSHNLPHLLYIQATLDFISRAQCNYLMINFSVQF